MTLPFTTALNRHTSTSNSTLPVTRVSPCIVASVTNCQEATCIDDYDADYDGDAADYRVDADDDDEDADYDDGWWCWPRLLARIARKTIV